MPSLPPVVSRKPSLVTPSTKLKKQPLDSPEDRRTVIIPTIIPPTRNYRTKTRIFPTHLNPATRMFRYNCRRHIDSLSTAVTNYRASSTESCSRSALSLLPSADGSGYCTSSCYSILGRENAEKCCQSADSIETYPVTCHPCKLCVF